MDINQLKLNYEYLSTRQRLEEELRMVNREICSIQNNCKHVIVTLGTTHEKCIVCGSTDPNKVNSYSHFIDATFYKKEKYGEGRVIEEREGKFSELQRVWLNFMTEQSNDSIDNKIRLLIKHIKEN